MIAALKRLPESLQELVATLAAVAVLLREIKEQWSQARGVQARVEALETEQAKWHAQVEAELVRVESRYKAARSAEERARTLERHAEARNGATDLDEEGEGDLPPEYANLLRQGYGAPSEDEAVQPMLPGVANHREDSRSSRERAKLAKFGRL